MALRGWVTGERHKHPRLPENKWPEGVIGEGREEEEGKDLEHTTEQLDIRP